MSGLLSSPHSYDSNFVEGTVTNIDPIRFVCSVRTSKGQFFSDVSWLLPSGGAGKSGIHLSPNIGDQVVITTALSYPIIIGCLPRLGNAETQLTNVSGASLGVDAGSSSNLRNGVTSNPNKPSDFTPGDYTITSEGGGILTMLANGSIFLKSSPLAQLLISKFDDLVRVVARNWERISDVGQQTTANINGRLYEFMGWDRNLSRSKVAIYELKDIIGDVAAGSVLKGEPNPGATLPAKDSRIRKYSLENTSGGELMTEVLTDDGKIVVIVNNGGTTTTTHDNSKWEGHVLNGTYSVITILPGSILIDHNGISKVLLDSNQINLDHNGVSKVHMDGDNLKVEHGGSTSADLTASSLTLTQGGTILTLGGGGMQGSFSGHAINMDSSGVHLS